MIDRPALAQPGCNSPGRPGPKWPVITMQHEPIDEAKTELDAHEVTFRVGDRLLYHGDLSGTVVGFAPPADPEWADDPNNWWLIVRDSHGDNQRWLAASVAASVTSDMSPAALERADGREVRDDE